MVTVWTWLTVTTRALSMTPSRLREVVGVQAGPAAANDGAPQVTVRGAPDQAGWFFNEFKPSARTGRETIAHRGSG